MSHAAHEGPSVPTPVRRKTYLVTDVLTPITHSVVKYLAYEHAHIVVATREIARTQESLTTMLSRADRSDETAINATFEVKSLDLTNLETMGDAVKNIVSGLDSLDCVIALAEAPLEPRKRLTHEKLEINWGVNFCGQWALVFHLLPYLRSFQSRVVTRFSWAANFGKLVWSDLTWDNRPYVSGAAYCDAALANALAQAEFAHIIDHQQWPIVSVGAHTGYHRNPPTARPRDIYGEKGFSWISDFVYIPSQPPRVAARSLMLAAGDPQALNGDVYGPARMWGLRGEPKKVAPVKYTSSEKLRRLLWQELTHTLGEDLVPEFVPQVPEGDSSAAVSHMQR